MDLSFYEFVGDGIGNDDIVQEVNKRLEENRCHRTWSCANFQRHRRKAHRNRRRLRPHRFDGCTLGRSIRLGTSGDAVRCHEALERHLQPCGAPGLRRG